MENKGIEEKTKKPRKPRKNITPTFNQRRVFDKVAEQVEKGGKVSVRKAIREAGLSHVFVNNPQRITKSKGWQVLMDKELNDKMLFRKHKELLNRKELTKIYDKEAGEVIVQETEHLDVQAVKAGLDMAYKLKGMYAAEKHDHTVKVSLLALYKSVSDGSGTPTN